MKDNKLYLVTIKIIIMIFVKTITYDNLINEYQIYYIFSKFR